MHSMHSAVGHLAEQELPAWLECPHDAAAMRKLPVMAAAAAAAAAAMAGATTAMHGGERARLQILYEPEAG